MEVLKTGSRLRRTEINLECPWARQNEVESGRLRSAFPHLQTIAEWFDSYAPGFVLSTSLNPIAPNDILPKGTFLAKSRIALACPIKRTEGCSRTENPCPVGAPQD